MTNPNASHPIWTWAFWKASIERVLFTFLECYFGIYLSIAVGATFDVFTFNWLLGLGPALGAAVLTLVKCLLCSLGGNPGPSAVNEVLTDYPQVRGTT
jgi:hypothetical protein